MVPSGWRCGIYKRNATWNLLLLPVRAAPPPRGDPRGFGCPCLGVERPDKKPVLALFYEMKCHLHFDGCLLRESVLIVPHNSRAVILAWPLARLAHSRPRPLAPRLQNNAVLPCLLTGPLWARGPSLQRTSPSQRSSPNSIAPLSSPLRECQRGGAVGT